MILYLNFSPRLGFHFLKILCLPHIREGFVRKNKNKLSWECDTWRHKGFVDLFYDFWIQKSHHFYGFCIQIFFVPFYNFWIQKIFGPYSQFLDPETAVVLQFLDPEILKIPQFLDPEIVNMDKKIYGSRNRRNGAISGSRNRRKGRHILYRFIWDIYLFSAYFINRFDLSQSSFNT